MLFLIFPFLQTLDYITIVLLLAGIFVAGSLFFGSGHNLRSFFAGGGNIPWWIGGLSLFMSFFSAGTFVVWGSIAYTEGWTAVTIQWMMAGGGVIAGLLIAPRWNRTGCLTAAEYITRRFGARVQKFYTALFLSVSLFSTGSSTPSPASSKRPSASPSSRVSWFSDCSASSTWPSAASGPSW